MRLAGREVLHDFAAGRRFLDGRYTPLAVERLCEEIGDSGGVSNREMMLGPPEVFGFSTSCERCIGLLQV